MDRELWEQPFQAYAIDADYVKPDGQNSVISFVISKWLLPELSFSDRWPRGMRHWERDLALTRNNGCMNFTRQGIFVSKKVKFEVFFTWLLIFYRQKLCKIIFRI